MAEGMDHYIRLVVFAVEGCPQPLVELFLKKAKADIRPGVPFISIDSYLQYHQTTLQNMLRQRFIHVDQLPLILPNPSDPPVDVKKWDISLVTTMLQNIFKPLSRQEQQYIGDIRSVRNELLHKSGTAELDDSDFIAKWNTLETAITGLAQCVSAACSNEMTSYITNMKTKSLPPPGPVLDILKQWYTADKELLTDTKLAVATSKGVKNILNDVVVRRTKPSGKVMKKIKSVDPVLESMRENFKLTMKRFRTEDYLPPDEMEDVKSKFRHYHRVSITGKGGLELALNVINDQDIKHDRCVQVTEADECRHVWCDDVDLVLCINPFGKDVYDQKRAAAMTKQFDRMLEHANLGDGDGRIDVVIVSETSPFQDYCRQYDHDLLDQVVTLNKPTTQAEPIQVSDCLVKMTYQPEPILQNMKGHTKVYLNQLRSLHIDENVSLRAKSIFKKQKAMTITGSTLLKKEVLAERLMSDYRREECLILNKPGDWKYVKLGDVSVILINHFTGKYKYDPVLYTKWLSIFDLIHAAVKGGKLNLILTSHTSYLQECQSQIGTHDLLEHRVELTDKDMVKTSIKAEDGAPEACTSSHGSPGNIDDRCVQPKLPENQTVIVIDAPYSYIKESCLTYTGTCEPKFDNVGNNVIRSFCTVSDGTLLMIGAKKIDTDRNYCLYHIDSSYNYINKLTVNKLSLYSTVVCLNKREAAVCTDYPCKIHIVSLCDEMRVTRTFDIQTDVSIYSAMAYMDGDFFIPTSSCHTIDVYSVTGIKVHAIEYDRNCGEADKDELVKIEKVIGIAVDDDQIIMRVRDNNDSYYILSLKMNGERIWLLNIGRDMYFKNMRSMCIDKKGNTYYISTDSEIHRVSACGQNDEVLLKYPVMDYINLCIDVKRDVLYLNYDHVMLHVYKLC